MLGLCAATTIAGCTDDPLPPTEVQRQIQANLGDLLDETNRAMTTAQAALPTAADFALVERVVGVDTPVAQAVAQLAARLAVPAKPFNVPTIVAGLNTQVFSDAHYHGDGSYDLSPVGVCALLATSDPAGCITRLTALDVQLQATVSAPPPGEPTKHGIAVTVQLGPHHVAPLTLALTTASDATGSLSTALTATLDLDLLQAALASLPSGTIAKTALAGKLTTELRDDESASGQGASVFRLSIDRALSIAVAGPSGDLAGVDAFSFTTAAMGSISNAVSTPPVSGGEPGHISFAFGQTALELPAGADGVRHGFTLTGTDLVSSFADPAIHTDLDLNLGLAGPLTITRNGKPARTFVLNPNDGNRLTLTVGAAPLALDTPKLDLRMTADHAVLGDAPAFDVSQILLAGTVQATAAPTRVALSKGTFQLVTAPTGHGFTAAAGQCITGTETTAPPPFVQWRVGACP